MVGARNEIGLSLRYVAHVRTNTHYAIALTILACLCLLRVCRTMCGR